MDTQTRETLVLASRPVRLAAAAALAMLALFLLVKTGDAISLFGQGQNPEFNTIVVSGMGTSSAAPDIAKLSFTVQETAADVKSAQDAATKKTNDAIASLKDSGVADKDVKTTDYTVQPQYAAERAVPCVPGQMCSQAMVLTNKITGYQVSQSVQVTVRDTSKAGDILQKLGTLGVQNISGPNFTLDDDNGVMSDARAEAIQNARDKAKEMAKELGVSLGEVVGYSDQGDVMPYDSYAKAETVSASAPAPTLPPGETQRTVNVQVTYRIK